MLQHRRRGAVANAVVIEKGLQDLEAAHRALPGLGDVLRRPRRRRGQGQLLPVHLVDRGAR